MYLRKRNRGGFGGHPDLLAIIAIIGILVALLLSAIESMRKASPEGAVIADHVETTLKFFGFVTAIYILAVIAEEGACMIGLGAHQWRRRRIFRFIRKGIFDRALYAIIGMGSAIGFLWIVGVRPQQDFLATSPWYPLQVTLLTFFLITSHVVYRAVRRWNLVKHHEGDYWVMFHTEAAMHRVESMRSYNIRMKNRDTP